MAENKQNNTDSTASVLSHAASAAGTAKSALKTGKAVAGMSKGAAAGPYGMLAAGLWENRRIIGKILAAFGALLLIPILYIMMLPSLIFGNDGLDNADGDVLNDVDLIMENIAETETSIETILREKHDAVLADIQAETDKLGSDCEYSITDEFADRIVYESALIISQFCASQANYQEINLAKLEKYCAITWMIFSPIPLLPQPMRKRLRIQEQLPPLHITPMWFPMPETATLRRMYSGFQMSSLS